MTIETKYNIGDKVWFMDRKIRQRVVDEIRVEQKWRDLDMGWVGKPVIKYWINCVSANITTQLSSANCIQQCVNNVQTNLQQVDNVLTQRLNINFKKLKDDRRRC